jgi:uncharacterized membrane protein YjgN (DUF898 family)
MKNYFDFSLTGKKFLPVWILYMILFIIPYSIFILQIKNIQPGETPPLYFFPAMLIEILIVFLLSYYIAKLSIEGINYSGNNLQFTGSFGRYAGIMIVGLILSIITIGIYSAWFTRDIMRFFTKNTSLDSEKFSFKGKGGTLLVILLLSIILPMVLITFIMAKAVGVTHFQSGASAFVFQIIVMLILIPYIYLVYKWMVDIGYKTYSIKWDTDFWNACGKILLELFLCLITLGIYFPMAVLKLYKYFTARTYASSPEKKLHFDFDQDNLNDFLFIWGQILLTIITLGIYYPWSYSKIGKRLLSKTYIEQA